MTFRPARRRTEPEVVTDTGEAQKKFGGDVKAISSDMYFGKQDNSEVGVCACVRDPNSDH